MYRGINGTPPSRAPSCTNPTPLNYHRPPPLRPSLVLRFLSLSLHLILSLYSFLLVFLLSPPLPRLPRIPCHLSNSIPLCLSIICTRACISARLSVSRPSRLVLRPPLRPAVLRLSPRYDHLRIRLPSTRPRSAPEQPSIRYRCVQPRGKEPLLPG